MTDNLTHLEGRVEGLIQHLERALRRNEELRHQAGELEAESARLKAENAQLQDENLRLQEELESTSGKEDVIRDRLRGILSKIDTIEREIGASEVHGG